MVAERYFKRIIRDSISGYSLVGRRQFQQEYTEGKIEDS